MNINNLQIIKTILPLFFSWKIAIILVTFLGLSFLPHTNQSGDIITDKSSINYWEKWANWDGQQYLSIAQDGHTGYKTAFFPLYPLLIRFLGLIGLSHLWTGLILANTFAFFTLFFLYKLAMLDYPKDTSKKIIMALLIFPTSFFLGAVYTESLFLMLTLAAFYYARKDQWLIAFLLAGLAGATRLVGIAVITAILFEYYLTHKNLISSSLSSRLNRFLIYSTFFVLVLKGVQKYYLDALPSLLNGLLITLVDIFITISIFLVAIYLIKTALQFKKNLSITDPLLLLIISVMPPALYCLYLYLTTNNPLGFLDQSGWGRSITFPWIPLISDSKYLISQGVFVTGKTHWAIIEYLFALFLLIIFIRSFSKIRASYFLYFAASILLIFSSGTFLSIPRLSLTVFPIYFLIGNIKNNEIFNSWIIISSILLGLFSVLFVGFYQMY